MKSQLLIASLSLLSIAVLALLLTPGQPVQADPGVLYVAPGGDCAGATPCYASVQAAVDAAAPGDEIRVATGVYTDVSVRPRADVETTGVVTQVVYISKTVTLHGGYTTTNWTAADPASNPTTLDAQGQGRVMYITGAISPTIEGLRITGGNAAGLGGISPLNSDGGGGVYVITAVAAINNNRVFSNTATTGLGRGGGVYLSSGGVTLDGNIISHNAANSDGGGVYVAYKNSATLGGNLISGNTALTGGGLAVFGAAVLSGNVISSNTATVYGGGLIIYGSADLSSNLIQGNIAEYGGGMSVYAGGATLNSNVIVRNTATYCGGGLLVRHSWSTDHRRMVAANSDTINGNTATYCGGGLFLSDSDVTLANTLVTDNQSSGQGSGLYVYETSHNASIRLLQVTSARNSGGDGSGIYVYAGTPFYTLALTNTILVSHTIGIKVVGGNTVIANGVLWYNTPITISQDAPATVTVQNQYYGDPAFAPDGYHLTVASAALDRGLPAGVTTDIDGQPRFGLPDLGADEFWPPGLPWYVYLPMVMRGW